jgi:intein-encoded DNA endonuclease-like protein
VDKEGYIEIQMNKSIDLLESGSIFFFQIKDGLEKHFGIKSTNSFTDNRVVVRKDGIKTKPIRLKIKRRQSVQKFATLIGFEDKVKQKKLLKAISRL